MHVRPRETVLAFAYRLRRIKQDFTQNWTCNRYCALSHLSPTSIPPTGRVYDIPTENCYNNLFDDGDELVIERNGRENDYEVAR